jgi:hypothetical protein
MRVSDGHKLKVIVLDIHMGRNEVMPLEINSYLPDTKILAMSFSNDRETTANAESYGSRRISRQNDTCERINSSDKAVRQWISSCEPLNLISECG